MVGIAEEDIAEVEFFHRETEYVPSAESAQVDTVFFTGSPVEFPVEVVEVHPRVVRDMAAQ